jgi:hypothetical protein
MGKMIAQTRVLVLMVNGLARRKSAFRSVWMEMKPRMIAKNAFASRAFGSVFFLTMRMETH